jgi:hypothetical protein
MIKKLFFLALIVGLGLGGSTLWQCAAGQQPSTEDERIAQLVKQLGSMKFVERDKAKHELEAIGLPALEYLRKAAKNGDLEVACRCQELIKKLENKIAVDQLLTPKKVHLDLKDVTVQQALDDLQKQSGYTIDIQGDRAQLAKRKITLDTGVVTFLAALDQLCEKAHLVEVVNANFNPTYYGIEAPVMRVPIQKVFPPAPPLPPQGQPKALPGAPVPGAVQGGALQGQPPPVAVAGPMALPVQVELPAIAAKAKVGMAGQAGQPGQGGQGGVGGGAGQPGQPGQPAKVQFQIQPVQIQPMPAQPALQLKKPVQMYPNAQIVLRDGKAESVPTFYYGALRIRLLPANRATDIAVQPRQKDEVLFILEVTPEPGLQGFTIVGSPRIEKALDDLGQELALAMEPMGTPGHLVMHNPYQLYNPDGVRQAALRLKLGEKPAKTLASLTGNLTFQALNPKSEAIITVPDVLKPAGKAVKGSNGGSIQVMTLEKQNDGSYRVVVRFEQPQQQGGAVNIRGGFGGGQVIIIQQGGQQVVMERSASTSKGNQGLPVLVDAKGKALDLTQVPQRIGRVVDGKYVQELTMIFRATGGVGEPASMVLFGQRLVTAQVPFQFKNLQLP